MASKYRNVYHRAAVEYYRAPKDLKLRCRCGHVRGVANRVAPHAGFRFVCYCQDCQAFARFLDRPDVLDAAGGTDIFHVPMGRLKLTADTDAVRCLQFSSRVFRWYADCCRTPIGNTAGHAFRLCGQSCAVVRLVKIDRCPFWDDPGGIYLRDGIIVDHVVARRHRAGHVWHLI